VLTVNRIVQTPSITTDATPTSAAYGSIRANATITGIGGFSPYGSVTIAGYLDDPTCAGTPYTSTTANVGDNSATVTGPFLRYIPPGEDPSGLTPLVPGTYTWRVSYSGNADNNAVSQCGGPGGTSVVSKGTPTGEITLATDTTAGRDISALVSWRDFVDNPQINEDMTVHLSAYFNDASCAGTPVFAVD
jgi:hypothetical protein